MYLNLKHKIICEVIISLTLFAIYFALYLNTDSLIISTFFLGADSTVFPKAISLATSVLCALLIINSITIYINYKKNKITDYMKTMVSGNEEYYPAARILIYLFTLVLYCLGFYYLGFLISTPFVLIIVGYLLGLKRIFIAIIFAIAFTILLDYGTLHFLQILLPRGELWG